MILHQVSRTGMDMKAQSVLLDMLKMFGAKDVDSSVVMLAVADLVGLTAARLDVLGGTPSSLDDRLHSFEARVREAYAHYRKSINGNSASIIAG